MSDAFPQVESRCRARRPPGCRIRIPGIGVPCQACFEADWLRQRFSAFPRGLHHEQGPDFARPQRHATCPHAVRRDVLDRQTRGSCRSSRRTGAPLRCPDRRDAARDVHKRLFGKVWDWAGVFRQTEKNIGASQPRCAPASTMPGTGARTAPTSRWKPPHAFPPQAGLGPPLCERKRTLGADHGRCISGQNRSRPLPRLVRRRDTDRRQRPPRAVHCGSAIGRRA